MSAAATQGLYLESSALEATASVVAVAGVEVALDRTLFYPGGGGQPPDAGTLTVDGEACSVTSLRADEDGRIWHVLDRAVPEGWLGRPAVLRVDAGRRLAHARHHTLLHILNTVALRHHGGGITGCQIGADYSRIDLALEDFSPAVWSDLEARTNAVIAAAHPVRVTSVSEDEFRRRDDLRRTLDVAPPVIGGRVRVVEIEGFDAQACGGTHAASTADLGACAVFRTENKGRRNKRLYVRLTGASA